MQYRKREGNETTTQFISRLVENYYKFKKLKSERVNKNAA